MKDKTIYTRTDGKLNTIPGNSGYLVLKKLKFIEKNKEKTSGKKNLPRKTERKTYFPAD